MRDFHIDSFRKVKLSSRPKFRPEVSGSERSGEIYSYCRTPYREIISPSFLCRPKKRSKRKTAAVPPLAKNPFRSLKYKKASLRSTLVFFNASSSNFLYAPELEAASGIYSKQ